MLDKASPCAPSSFSVIQDVGIQSDRLQCTMGSVALLLLPSASCYSIFLLRSHYFRHDFLTSLYKYSVFSSLNLLLCCLSLRDGDKIPFVFKECCYNICVAHIPSFTHILLSRRVLIYSYKCMHSFLQLIYYVFL